MKYKNLILVVLSTLVFSGIFSFNYLVDLDSVYFYKEAYFDLTNKINIAAVVIIIFVHLFTLLS